MKADVYVELPSAPGGQPRVAVRRGKGLEEVKAASFKGGGQTKAIAFAPALSVAAFRVPITARSESEARRAALYAIEDELAQPVEDVHLTLGPRNRAGTNRDIYVVDKSVFEGWMSALQQLGLRHAPIIPENSLAYPEATIMNFGDRLVLASAGQTVGVDGNLPQDAVDALIDAAGLSGARTNRNNSLTYLSDLYNQSPGIALAGTGSQSANTGSSSGFRYWRVAGALAVVAIVVWVASLWAETSRLSAAASRNEITARTMFLTQFPGAPEPVDIHAEIRRQAQLSLSGGDSGLRPLSSALYEAIAQSDTIQLVGMTYSGADRAINARLLFANRADELAFRNRLEAAGWSVEGSGATELPTGVEAAIVMRARQ